MPQASTCTSGDGPRFESEVAILTLEGPALMYFGLVEKKVRLASVSDVGRNPAVSGISFASAAPGGCEKFSRWQNRTDRFFLKN